MQASQLVRLTNLLDQRKRKQAAHFRANPINFSDARQAVRCQRQNLANTMTHRLFHNDQMAKLRTFLINIYVKILKKSFANSVG